ncbi:MAG: carboxypeptidase regulatory-like domain-containing protein, partial [Acidobacteriota bacterium]|nr:carboxypeptidase regulatory-like domain-containing protein [Acidobacteriota bacterium]
MTLRADTSTRSQTTQVITRAVSFVVIFSACAVAVSAQSRGHLHGTVRNAAGAAVSGVTVVVVNQVTSRTWRIQSRPDGSYSLRLPAGAYRISFAPPYVAIFDKNVQYGELALVRADALENVIIESGKDTNVDISLAERSPLTKDPDDQDVPAGYAGATSVPSAPQTTTDRREARDRWRIGFPEYDRYGDRGGRGRDIPFKKGHWWDPYNQSVLKGDYPIKGNQTFFVFSATDTSTVELRRVPTASGVSADDSRSAEFLGQPEQLALNETLQLSFELFHGDTAFKPRDWAIKISPTFSIPNYLNARENGVVNVDVRRGTNRTDTHVSLEEAFGEVKLADLSANFDFVSVRVGIQPFV